MNISYIRDCMHNYMLFLPSGEQDTGVEEKMLCNHRSGTLLPFHVRQEDGHKCYYYDITGLIALDRWLEVHAADAEMLRSVIGFIIGLCGSVDEYLLDPGSLLLDPEYIYVDTQTGKLFCAYIPGMSKDLNVQLKTLTVCFLEHADHTDGECVRLAYGFYHTVQTEGFSPSALRELQGEAFGDLFSAGEDAVTMKKDYEAHPDTDLRPKRSGKKADKKDETHSADTAQKNRDEGHTGGMLFLIICSVICCAAVFAAWRFGCIESFLVFMDIDVDPLIAVMVLLMAILAVNVIAGVIMAAGSGPGEEKGDSGEVWNESDFNDCGIFSFTEQAPGIPGTFGRETTVLSRSGNVRLVSLNKNITQDIVISDFPCILGSRKESVQVLLAATGISRQHARFERTQEGVYVTDLCSTNGTYVNDRRLEKDEKKLLLVEDIIQFADIRFMFCTGG